MDFTELKNRTEKDLHDLLAEKRGKLRDLRFKASEKQLKNVKSIKDVRVDIAQILTLLNSIKKTKVEDSVKDNK